MVRRFKDQWDAIQEMVQRKAAEWGYDGANVRQGMLGDQPIDGSHIWISLLPGNLIDGLSTEPIGEQATCTIWHTASSPEGRAAARAVSIERTCQLLHFLFDLDRKRIELHITGMNPVPVLVEVEGPTYSTTSTEFLVPITYR
jgi:hypothetical protein